MEVFVNPIDRLQKGRTGVRPFLSFLVLCQA